MKRAYGYCLVYICIEEKRLVNYISAARAALIAEIRANKVEDDAHELDLSRLQLYQT